MTSGNFRTIEINSITIDREKRQRKELKNITELAWSISSIGLINPVVLTPELVLVAGERRLQACTSLGWTHIPAHLTIDLEDEVLHLIELEENVRRESLTWQEECLAVEEYHRLKSNMNEEWNQAKTAEALCITAQEAGRKVQIANEIINGNEAVISADKYSVARNLTIRKAERASANQQSNALAALAVSSGEADTIEEGKAQVEKRSIPLKCTDFILWQQKYKGPKFNLIHCDFPYGINAGNQQQGTNTAMHGEYEDDAGTYYQLIEVLAQAMENVVDESAHLIFWFSPLYYENTKLLLDRMGWTVNPFPLIWHKPCNTGLLPDPDRGPRRTYEMAFFGSRGDRKIVRAVSNSIGTNAPKGDDKYHMSQKSSYMLNHFLKMLVDEYTTFLDPTCGSGSAVKMAEELGAKTVLGLEKSREFYNLAKENYYV